MTSQAPGQGSRTRVSGFAYDAATGLLTKEVIEPGSGDVAGCVSAAAGTGITLITAHGHEQVRQPEQGDGERSGDRRARHRHGVGRAGGGRHGDSERAVRGGGDQRAGPRREALARPGLWQGGTATGGTAGGTAGGTTGGTAGRTAARRTGRPATPPSHPIAARACRPARSPAARRPRAPPPGGRIPGGKVTPGPSPMAGWGTVRRTHSPAPTGPGSVRGRSTTRRPARPGSPPPPRSAEPLPGRTGGSMQRAEGCIVMGRITKGSVSKHNGSGTQPYFMAKRLRLSLDENYVLISGQTH